jgi:hypothetical protein
MKKVLKFHTGRGGRFFNPGHVSFVGFERIDEGNTFEDLFLSDDEKICRDASGNELDFEINSDGTGYVNEDYDYNRTDCVLEDDLTASQVVALIRERDGYLSDEINRILNEYYDNYI